MRARRQIVDPLTGAAVRRTSPVAVDTGAKVVGKDTVVPEEDLDPSADRYGIEREAVPRLREDIAAAKRRQAARKPKGRGAGVKLTMPSVEAGVEHFEHLNPSLFDDNIEDPGDTTRDFLRSQEIRTGKRSVPVIKTKRGKEILAQRGERMVKATLAFLFGQAPSRRWRDVPWMSVQTYLDEINTRNRDAGPAPITYPIAAGLDSPDEMLARARDELGPDAAAKLVRQINAEELRALAERLETAIERNGEECLTGEAVRAAKERLRIVRRWARNPELVPEWSCVGSRESEGEACSFPAILDDIKMIERSCSEDYDPKWPIERAARACDAGEDEGRTGVIGEPCAVRDTAKAAKKPAGKYKLLGGRLVKV